MRTGIGRVTIHDVMDGADGQYYEEEFSLSYDYINGGDWHYPAFSTDKFKRTRVIDSKGEPVVTDTTDAEGWDYIQYTPIKGVDYTDGSSGDTIYEIYQYSVDGLTLWHEEFKDEDVYRQTAVVMNGSPSAWSPAARINGLNGVQTNILNLYQVKPQSYSWTPEELVTEDLTYLVLTGSIADYDSSVGVNGWKLSAMNLTGSGNSLYQMSVAFFSDAGELEVEVPYDTWSTPIALSTNGIDGTQGTHGSGSYIITMPVDEVPLVSDKEGTEYVMDTHLEAVALRPAQAGDILTYTDDTYSEQYLRGEEVWNQFTLVVDGSAIINGTLAAEALIADSITGEQIKATTKIVVGDIINTPTTNNVAVMDGSGDDRIYAGNQVSANAPFRVTQAGKLFATNVDITGTVSGSVIKSPADASTTKGVMITADGKLYAQEGEFRGTIHADKIRGDVTSTNGKSIPETVMYNGSSGGSVTSSVLVTFDVSPQPKACFVIVQLPIAYEMVFASQMMCQFSVNGAAWTQNLAPIYGVKLSSNEAVSIRLRYHAQNMGVGNVTFSKSFTTCTVSFVGDSVTVT